MRTLFRIIPPLMVLVLALSGCFLKPKTPETEAFDLLYLNARQYEAVDIEVLGRLQNKFDNKAALAEASALALNRLEILRKSTGSIRVSGDLQIL